MKKFMDEDFLLTSDAAKKLYHDYAENMPIVDYHCHINPQEICLLTPMIVLLQNLPRQLLALSEDTADRTEKSASVMKSGLFRL